MLPNVQQTTIKPLVTSVVAPGSLIYTDEYNIYDRLPGAMNTKRSIMRQANMPGMKTVMGFMKCMLIGLKAFGPCSSRGCVPIAIAAFR